MDLDSSSWANQASDPPISTHSNQRKGSVSMHGVYTHPQGWGHVLPTTRPRQVGNIAENGIWTSCHPQSWHESPRPRPRGSFHLTATGTFSWEELCIFLEHYGFWTCNIFWAQNLAYPCTHPRIPKASQHRFLLSFPAVVPIAHLAFSKAPGTTPLLWQMLTQFSEVVEFSHTLNT